MRFDYHMARNLFIATSSLSMFLAVYSVASAPSRQAERLGIRGLKRRRAIEAGGLFAQTEPLVRWMGVRVSGIMSEATRARLDRSLTLAGDYLGLTPEEYVGLCVLSAIGGAAFGALMGAVSGIGAPLLMMALGAIGMILPYLHITEIAQERLKIINRRLPMIIDLMALSMSAGLDFPGAVKQVVEKSSNPEDPLIEEMTRILQELQLGKTRRQVLAEFAARAPVDSVNEFVSALVQAEERGNPVSEVLQIQAVVSRQRRTVNAEEAAAKAGVKILGPLFMCFACILVLIVAPMVLTIYNKKTFD
jgi:tight adherence protein C